MLHHSQALKLSQEPRFGVSLSFVFGASHLELFNSPRGPLFFLSRLLCVFVVPFICSFFLLLSFLSPSGKETVGNATYHTARNG